MSKPNRLFIKVHNGFPEHPKTVELSDRAFRHLIEAWCFCSRNLNDGKLTEGQAARHFSKKTRQELVAVGFIDETPDGVQMHDYLDHQQSAQQVADLRERRAEAGSKGGRSKASRLASASPVAKQTPSTAVADTDTDTDTSALADASAPSATPRKRAATRLPEDWQPTDAHWERRHDGIDVQREAETFKAHAEANDRRCVNWNAAFTQWLLKARPSPMRDGKPMTRVQEHLTLVQQLAAEEAATEQPTLPQIGRTYR